MNNPQKGETFGRYSILGELGRGGMGVVLRARQDDLGREVALKILPAHLADQDEFAERFRREASLLAAVDSPHIIAIYDHGEHDGRLFIATQLVRGGDLAHHLREHGPLTLEQGLDLVAQLAAALTDAHEAGVLHRDVKPSNVLLRDTADGWHAYLCDFGIAHSGTTELTRAGSVVGTYGYLAPERCEGHPATVASDVYALGCVLVAALSGNAPYAGSDLKVAQQHISAPVPQWDPTFPGGAELNHIVQRSMAKHPEDRYASAQDMRRDLLAALQTLRSPAPQVPAAVQPVVERTVLRATPAPVPAAASLVAPPAPRPRRGAKLIGIVAAAAVFLAVLGTGGYLALRPSGKADPTPVSAPATHSAVASPTATASSSVSAPRPAATSSPSVAPTPTPTPTPVAPVSFPRRDVDCTGGYITVLAQNVGDNATPALATQAMQVFAHDARYSGKYAVHYLSTQDSCSDLLPGDGHVNPRLSYVPYLGPFNTAHDACQARLDLTPALSYVVKLTSDTRGAAPCACQFSADETPALSKSIGQSPDARERLWVSSAQTLFKILGYNNEDKRSGDYGPLTIGWVTQFQQQYGMTNVTGDLDGETWAALKQAACPDY